MRYRFCIGLIPQHGAPSGRHNSCAVNVGELVIGRNLGYLGQAGSSLTTQLK